MAFLDTEHAEAGPALSPDGRWLAYSSNESGQYEVYIRPFPGPGSQTTISSTDGGSYPVWARNGREIFYLDGRLPGVLTVATVRTEPDFRVESRDPLFPWTPFSTVGDSGLYDLSSEAQQILAIGLFSGSEEGGKVVLVESPCGPAARAPSSGDKSPSDRARARVPGTVPRPGAGCPGCKSGIAGTPGRGSRARGRRSAATGRTPSGLDVTS